MILSPGATIGILGAGQLGRMLASAALKVGLRTHVFAPDSVAPAYDAAAARTVAAFDDEEALSRFAEAVDIVTYEFENVPIETVEFLADRLPVRPGARALALTQDRLIEKTFLRDLGLRTAPFVGVEDTGALARAVAELGRPAILKTRRFGYDGKGQSLIREGSNVSAVHRALGGAPMILEGFVAFEREISVVAARSLEGDVVAYDLSENEHERHILARSRAPARIAVETALEAKRIATTILEALEYVGVLAVELFVIRDRQGREGLVVNEIAPRVHNSVIGRSTAPRPRSSNSTCAPSPAGRSARRPAAAGSKCTISSARTQRNGATFSPSPIFACISTASWKSGPTARWATLRASFRKRPARRELSVRSSAP